MRTPGSLRNVESLETRRLLSVSLDPLSGLLSISGTEEADVVRVGYEDSSSQPQIVVRMNSEQSSFPAADVNELSIDAAEGDDRVVVSPRVTVDAVINGGDGNDRIVGGSGSDTLSGGDGNDRIAGRRGDDQISGDAGRDVLAGGGGSDVLVGGADSDRLRGGPEADSLSGGPGNDRIFGHAGDDTLDGGDGQDVLRGGPGQNTISHSAAPDSVPVSPALSSKQTPHSHNGASQGWDGPGRGSATLSYYLGSVPDAFRSAIARALETWANAVDITFLETNTPGQSDSIDFQFASLDGPGRTVAQAYLPDDVNQNPIAGDITFDSDESWEVGDELGRSALDITWVAVHEIGHALGIEHSDNRVSVMYPSVSSHDSFTELDSFAVDAAREIYASVGNEGTADGVASPVSEDPGSPPASPSTTIANRRWGWRAWRWWRIG